MAQIPIFRKVRSLTSEQPTSSKHEGGRMPFWRKEVSFRHVKSELLLSWQWLLFSQEALDTRMEPDSHQLKEPHLVFQLWSLTTRITSGVKKAWLCLTFNKHKSSQAHLAFITSIYPFVWMGNGSPQWHHNWLWLCFMGRQNSSLRGTKSCECGDCPLGRSKTSRSWPRVCLRQRGWE